MPATSPALVFIAITLTPSLSITVTLLIAYHGMIKTLQGDARCIPHT
ncbi:MAG: hypothetical protein QY305_11540 [Candidatus Brocadiaceae baterium WH-1]|nr:MAG: hypothetical protein QY305_11540 [Candidatus Jettenia sp. AMX2]